MRPRWSALFFCFIEDTADHIGAFLFLGLIQMGIDICRCGQVGVPEEGRYIQQRHILIDKDAGEGVAQVVEPNLAQTVLPDKVGETLRDPIRAYQPAELIDADIIVIFVVVAALEHSAVQVLLFPFLAQHFIHRVRQRQRAAAGFVFHFLHGFDDDLTVFLVLNDFGVAQYGFLFPVYSRPPCAQRLAAAQAVKGGHLNQQGVRMILRRFQQPLQLLLPVIVRNVPLLLGALHLVGGVEGNQVHFDGVFQCLVDIGVIVDHCTGRHGFQLVQIKALNVLGLDSVQRQSGVSEIRCNLSLYHLRVRGKGGLFHRAADNLQPQQRLRAGISCISTAAAGSRRTVISFIGVLSPFLRRKNAEQTWNGIKFGSASVRLA